MAAWGGIVAVAGVLALGAGVMVFKQQVDAEERRLVELRRTLVAAQAETGRLTAELAYHRRPAYLASFADSIGLVPAGPRQFVDLDALAPRPNGAAADVAIIALPSGGLATLQRRPAATQLVGLDP